MREVPKAIVSRLEEIEERMDPGRSRASDDVKAAMESEAFRLYYNTWVAPLLTDVLAWATGDKSAADLAFQDRHPYT